MRTDPIVAGPAKVTVKAEQLVVRRESVLYNFSIDSHSIIIPPIDALAMSSTVTIHMIQGEQFRVSLPTAFTTIPISLVNLSNRPSVPCTSDLTIAPQIFPPPVLSILSTAGFAPVMTVANQCARIELLF